MHLSEHFTLAEFTESDTAARMGIDNQVPPDLLPAATRTCELLERIRAKLSALAGRQVPIIITSGYRSARLNTAVGGQPSSDHLQAAAADFKAPAFGSPFEVCQALLPHFSELGVGQLIHEYGRWVHVSTRPPAKDLNRIITLSARGAQLGIVAV